MHVAERYAHRPARWCGLESKLAPAAVDGLPRCRHADTVGEIETDLDVALAGVGRPPQPVSRIGHDGARALDVPTGALTAIRRGAVEIDVVANAWIGC